MPHEPTRREATTQANPQGRAPSFDPRALAKTYPNLRPAGPYAHLPPIPLHRPVTLVGSRKTARIHLSSKSVSRAHALLVVTPRGVFVHDLQSRAGTHVNGEAVREMDLHDGDEIAVGQFSFVFRDPRPGLEDVAPPQIEPMILRVEGPPGSRSTRGVDLVARVTLIGRRPGSDLCLPYGEVSTSNTAVVRLEGFAGQSETTGGHVGYVAYDLGGRGTTLNGRPVHKAPFGPGDVLQIGPASLRLEPAPAEVRDVALTPATTHGDDVQRVQEQPRQDRYDRDSQDTLVADDDDALRLDDDLTPGGEVEDLLGGSHVMPALSEPAADVGAADDKRFSDTAAYEGPGAAPRPPAHRPADEPEAEVQEAEESHDAQDAAAERPAASASDSFAAEELSPRGWRSPAHREAEQEHHQGPAQPAQTATAEDFAADAEELPQQEETLEQQKQEAAPPTPPRVVDASSALADEVDEAEVPVAAADEDEPEDEPEAEAEVEVDFSTLDFADATADSADSADSGMSDDIALTDEGEAADDDDDALAATAVVAEDHAAPDTADADETETDGLDLSAAFEAEGEAEDEVAEVAEDDAPAELMVAISDDEDVERLERDEQDAATNIAPADVASTADEPTGPLLQDADPTATETQDVADITDVANEFEHVDEPQTPRADDEAEWLNEWQQEHSAHLGNLQPLAPEPTADHAEQAAPPEPDETAEARPAAVAAPVQFDPAAADDLEDADDSGQAAAAETERQDRPRRRAAPAPTPGRRRARPRTVGFAPAAGVADDEVPAAPAVERAPAAAASAFAAGPFSTARVRGDDPLEAYGVYDDDTPSPALGPAGPAGPADAFSLAAAPAADALPDIPDFDESADAGDAQASAVSPGIEQAPAAEASDDFQPGPSQDEAEAVNDDEAGFLQTIRAGVGRAEAEHADEQPQRHVANGRPAPATDQDQDDDDEFARLDAIDRAARGRPVRGNRPARPLAPPTPGRRPRPAVVTGPGAGGPDLENPVAADAPKRRRAARVPLLLFALLLLSLAAVAAGIAWGLAPRHPVRVALRYDVPPAMSEAGRALLRRDELTRLASADLRAAALTELRTLAPDADPAYLADAVAYERFLADDPGGAAWSDDQPVTLLLSHASADRAAEVARLKALAWAMHTTSAGVRASRDAERGRVADAENRLADLAERSRALLRQVEEAETALASLAADGGNDSGLTLAELRSQIESANAAWAEADRRAADLRRRVETLDTTVSTDGPRGDDDTLRELRRRLDQVQSRLAEARRLREAGAAGATADGQGDPRAALASALTQLGESAEASPDAEARDAATALTDVAGRLFDETLPAHARLAASADLSRHRYLVALGRVRGELRRADETLTALSSEAALRQRELAAAEEGSSPAAAAGSTSRLVQASDALRLSLRVVRDRMAVRAAELAGAAERDAAVAEAREQAEQSERSAQAQMRADRKAAWAEVTTAVRALELVGLGDEGRAVESALALAATEAARATAAPVAAVWADDEDFHDDNVVLASRQIAGADVAALEAEAADLRRQISQREAELRGAAEAEATRLRSEAAAAERRAAEVADAARAARESLAEAEARQAERERARQRVDDLRRERADLEQRQAAIREELDKARANADSTAAPLPVRDEDVTAAVAPDRRPLVMAIALPTLAAVFLVAIFLTMRSAAATPER